MTVLRRLRGVTLAITALLATTVIGFDYNNQKVRGVNLGGWLVLEPWITPSLFESTGNNAIVDEWTFGQLQDHSKAEAALKKHWDTWITESDFSAIAAAGLNHVRIPIGYWAWDSQNTPYIQGQLPYLQRAVGWAKSHGLVAIVDLHGAPGSQNGYDNSGQKKDQPEWHTKSSYVIRTNAIIKKIADLFKDESWVVIAPLNEPAGYRGEDVLDVVSQYWKDSYGSIRFPYGSGKQSDNLVLIHDAFQPLSYWTDAFPRSQFRSVAIDTHIYQVFSDAENRQSWSDHISTACSKGPTLGAFSKNSLYTIAGEWSLASTDCARYLNGRGIGARYDGSYPGSSKIGSCDGKSGSGANFSSQYKEFLRKFWEAQVSSYEQGTGYIFWTWKAESAAEWSYAAGLQGGWIPRNPTERKYPNICG